MHLNFSLKRYEFLFILLAWFSFLLFVLFNYHAGIGYFDSSEFAIHIVDSGIAHAPGYPLYILLGKFFYFFIHDAFLAQVAINVFSALLVIVLTFLSLTHFSTTEKILSATIACLLFLSGYLIVQSHILGPLLRGKIPDTWTGPRA